MNSVAVSRPVTIISRLVALLALSVGCAWFVHSVAGAGEIPLGARLLPLFYALLIAIMRSHCK